MRKQSKEQISGLTNAIITDITKKRTRRKKSEMEALRNASIIVNTAPIDFKPKRKRRKKAEMEEYRRQQNLLLEQKSTTSSSVEELPKRKRRKKSEMQVDTNKVSTRALPECTEKEIDKTSISKKIKASSDGDVILEFEGYQIVRVDSKNILLQYSKNSKSLFLGYYPYTELSTCLERVAFRLILKQDSDGKGLTTINEINKTINSFKWYLDKFKS